MNVNNNGGGHTEVQPQNITLLFISENVNEFKSGNSVSPGCSHIGAEIKSEKNQLINHDAKGKCDNDDDARRNQHRNWILGSTVFNEEKPILPKPPFEKLLAEKLKASGISNF